VAARSSHISRECRNALAAGRQFRLGAEQPKWRKAAMRAEDSSLVERLHLAEGLDGDRMRVALDADQARVVAEMVLKAQFLPRALDRERPVQHLLRRGGER